MAKRFIIIDGYNLLHVVGILGPNVGPGTLERARNTLLGMLAKYLDAGTRKRTTLVFDSREKNLPNRFTSHDVLVEFANEYSSADELINLLVRKHSAPKQLIVVSSDHQIQRVAIARGATPMDSDLWLDSLTKSPNETQRPKNRDGEKPDYPRNEFDVEYWKQQMDVEGILEDEKVSKPRKKNTLASDEPAELPASDSIFPPGYTDDLFDDA
ncbi:MAG: NYN domain-containing protein [Pirellulaceae bacterium]|nr:NYN domain-containing protein [Pirellulaceae bacterium]